ncbi:MAG: prolyl oligopeptidase family serine peptidase [Lachnospiraceae bacterium]|nr:prolyl oligopeptidase family serine peptidase [Lachnospiraceae bacterium]
MNYETITEVLDFGPFITKAILHLDNEISGWNPSPSDFHVHVTRTNIGPEVPWPIFMGPKPDMQMKGHRHVKAAYVSDKEGNKAESGKYVTLEFENHPTHQLGSIMVFNGIFNVSVDFKYEIALHDVEGKLGKADTKYVFDNSLGNKIVLGDLFKTGRHEDKEIPLNYVYYDPTGSDVTYTRKDKSSKYPLLIWLHGAGEGGEEPLIAVIGNKVTNLISEEIQEIFDGAYLLAPQCPTMWMNDGSGEYTLSGQSIYLEALDRLIGDFISEHPEIDTDRIYIGGDSNGGFMTMKQIIYNQDRYAAAFPVCEALVNTAISDEDIERLKELPIWFTHSATDTTVNPEEYPITTYNRLMKAGAKNVHFTYWDKIEDLSGEYKDENGNPYEYYGHWAWIPMLNNDCVLDFDKKPVQCDGKDIHILNWLAKQHK